MTEKNHSSKHPLPSLSDLFKSSWVTFKGSVLNLFILNIVTFAIFAGLVIVGLLTALPLGAFSIYSASQKEMGAAFLSLLGGAGIIVAVLIIVAILVSIAVQAASFLFVANYKSKPKFGATFKKGFSYIWKLFLLGIISTFIVLGGYFLFVIPGIFFGIIFAFAPYEVVINKQGVLPALRRSSEIVMSHFWGIFGRMVLWIVIVMAVAFLPQMMANGNSAAGISFLSSILNIILGWYGIAYSINLYKEASVGHDSSKGNKIIWPVVVAIVGWIVGIIFISTLVTVMTAAITQMAKNSQMRDSNMRQLQNIPTYYPSNSPRATTTQ